MASSSDLSFFDSFSDKAINQLPILNYEKEIIENVKRNKVVVINGHTGSGKTTKVPQFILDDALMATKNCKILVSQPRKIAAISVAVRVANERKCMLGGEVGFQVGLHKMVNKMNNETKLLFATTGVILQKIIYEGGIQNYTHIILDEVHERDIDTDMLITIIRDHLAEPDCSTKLILMSATIDVNTFISYFECSTKPLDGEFLLSNSLLDGSHSPNKVIIESETNRYKVDVYYLDDLKKIFVPKEDTYIFDSATIDLELYELAATLIGLYLKKYKKSILVFLPGIFEIETAFGVISARKDLKDKCIISVLHSSLPAIEQRAAIRLATLPNVILSTNIAESSLTIPNVGCVIDFCLTKNIVGNGAALSALKLNWTTKHSCIQRAGRTGRMCNGLVYRLVFKKFYMDNFTEENVPEMQRAPLETVILRIKQIDSESPKTFLSKTMDPPAPATVARTLLHLKELGALTLNHPDSHFNFSDGELTFLGRVMATLPIDCRLSKLITLGFLFSVFDDTIIIAAGLSVKNLFKQHFNRKMKDYMYKLQWANMSSCDSIAILNAYRSWLDFSEKGVFERKEDEEVFCNTHNLERKALREMRQLISEIEGRLEFFVKSGANQRQLNDEEKQLMLKVCIAGAFIPNYFVYGDSDEHDQREASKTLYSRDIFNTVYYRKMELNRISEFYADQIREQLVKDGIADTTRNIDVFFESSKVLVQFNDPNLMIDDGKWRDKSLRKQVCFAGKIPKEVYKSVFFRKFCSNRQRSMKRYDCCNDEKEPDNSTMQLRVLESERDEEEYAIKHGLGEIVDGSFKLKQNFVQQPEMCILPGFGVKKVQGFVTHVEHCNKFYFRPYDGSEIYFEELQMKLMDEELTEARNPRENDLIVVSQDYNKRAKITKIDEDRKIAECFLVDFGQTVEVSFSKLFTMTEEKMRSFFSISERCFECTLFEITPNYVACPRGKWTKEAIQAFKEFAQGSVCDIEVYSVVDDKVSVILCVNGVNINELLVMNGFASKQNEPIMSKINHNERIMVQETLGCIPKEREFVGKVNKLLKVSVPSPPLKDCSRVVKLLGPFTPLERSITELSVNCYQDVKISPQSVNCVTLNDSIDSFSGKLLVASEIIQNTLDDVSLHGVTVMPNIYGLAQIFAMIFSPAISFHRNSDKKIAKMRCGLGMNLNYQTRVPLFVEHDCILPINFDVEKDFKNVNELRKLLSHIYMETPDEKLFDMTLFKHLEVKETLMKILSREREPYRGLSSDCNTVVDDKWDINDDYYLIPERGFYEFSHNYSEYFEE